MCAFGAVGSSTSEGISDPPTVGGSTTGVVSFGVSQDTSTVDGGEFAYKILAATGTQSVVWTYSSDAAGNYAGVVQGYIAASGASGFAQPSRLNKRRPGDMRAFFQPPVAVVSAVAITSIDSTPGTWTWAGTTASFTSLLNATPGTWQWDGVATSFTSLLNATPGTWTWAGTTASFTSLLNAIPGTWQWDGVPAQIVQFTVVDSTPGAWTWAGSQAEIPVQVAATPGTWQWNGAAASFTSLLSATPGTWQWDGVPAQIVQSLTIDSTPGVWAWAGTLASLLSGSAPTRPRGAPPRFDARIVRRNNELLMLVTSIVASGALD